jgi:peptidoglycan/LPS O-acetylase OafA/YrhL
MSESKLAEKSDAPTLSLAVLVVAPGVFRLALAAAVAVSHLSRLDIGRLAVLLFFYLSGYWTARIWAQKFESKKIGWFYAARYLRIAPLFLLATVGAALLRHLPLHAVNFTLLGIASSDSDPTGVSWSLDVELQFYLLLPFIAAGLSQRRWRAFCLAGIAVLAILGWYAESHYGIRTVAKFLPVFALGVLTYSLSWKPSDRTAALSLAAFAFMTLFTTFTPFLSKMSVKPFDQDVWSFIWLLPLLPYIMRSLMVRSSRLDRHFGNLSYPFYLVHYAVIAWATARFGYGAPVKAGALMAAALVALTIYWLADRPMDKLRVRFTETPLQPAPAATETAIPS